MTQHVTRSELEALLAAGHPLTIVDALPQGYYAEQHLPGAINIVESDVRDVAADLLPDKHATVITYCSNEACSNSSAVARRLESLGYADVRTYPAGIQDWVEAGNPTETTVAS